MFFYWPVYWYTKFFEKRIEFKEINVILCKYDMYCNLIKVTDF